MYCFRTFLGIVIASVLWKTSLRLPTWMLLLRSFVFALKTTWLFN
jgi:hypothetical protein